MSEGDGLGGVSRDNGRRWTSSSSSEDVGEIGEDGGWGVFAVDDGIANQPRSRYHLWLRFFQRGIMTSYPPMRPRLYFLCREWGASASLINPATRTSNPTHMRPLPQ